MTEAEKTSPGSRPRGSDGGLWHRAELKDDDLRRMVDLADCLDVLLFADGRLRIEHIEAFPSGFDPYGCSVVELALAGSQLPLREAAERCLNSGTPQTVVVELRGDLTDPTLVKLMPIEAKAGPSVLLAGLSAGRTAATLVDAERRRLENLDRLLEVAPIALFNKDANARFTWANRRLLDTLEAETVADIWGRDDFDFHPRSEATKYFADDQQVLKSGEGFESQEEVQTRTSGEVEIIRTTKLPILRPDGTVEGIMGFFTEVTEPTLVAEKLRRTEQRFLLAAAASRDGVWELDMVNNRVHLSRRARELLGTDVKAEEISWDEFVSTVNEDEIELIKTAIEAALSQPGETVSHVVEFNSARSKRYVELVGSALVEDGKVVALVGTAADVTEDRLREETLVYQAGHDDLTGLVNRRTLIRQISRCIDERVTCSLLYLDLDSFRTVNDSLGHSFGDDLLRALAARLQSIVLDGSVVARIGADEFAVLLIDTTAPKSQQVADRIIAAIAKPFTITGAEIYTGASIGIAHLDSTSKSAEEVVRDADIALYHAKDDGKGCSRVFDARMRQSADDELELHTRLRRAVERREFELHYQPIFESVSCELVGVEALVRWNAPDGHQARPNVFLPHLEKTGLIKEVGSWVIDEGCRQLSQWRKGIEVSSSPVNPFYIAINLSRVQFEADDLIDVVTSALTRHNLAPSDLILEVTETAVSRDPQLTAEVLARIQSQGVQVAIDDFGVGESSLSVLYEMPANIVKIDKSFIDRISSEEDEPVISAVFQMARALGLATVAEGVETELQKTWLTNQQCDSLQGYLLSTPLPAEELAHRWLGFADD